MLSVVIGLLTFGVTIPRFEAYTNWKKTELNSTNHHSLIEKLERPPALNSFTNQRTIPIQSYFSKGNNTCRGKIYEPKKNFISPAGWNVRNKKTDFTAKVFRASKLFRPKYISLKDTCDRTLYKVYSNNEKSAMFRNNYELWNINYFPDSLNHKIRRSEPADEFSDDTHFILDDDYSLLNYIDSWKGIKKVDEEGSNDERETIKRGTLRKGKKMSKRESVDKEFSVMFHSRKDHEFRDTLPNSYDFYKNGKKKNMLHLEKKKYRHDFGSKLERKLSFMERRNNLKESYDHVARTSLNLRSSKKKYPFWSSRKDKAGAKLDTLRNALLTSSRGSMTSLVPPRSVLHWATTRSYVAAISQQNRIPQAFMTSKVPLVAPMLIPFLNLTDSILTARKSDVSSSPSPVSINQAAVQVNQSGSPQYLRLGNNHLDLRNMNPNLQFPFAFNIPIAKQSEHNAAVYGPPVQVTTPVVFFFNAPTEGINPLCNHLDTFKNTTTWNTKQGPPCNLNALSSLMNFVNYQIDGTGNYNESNSRVEQGLQFPRHLDKTQKSLDVDVQGLTPPTRRAQYVQDTKIDPITVDPRPGPDVTPGPFIGAEALVRFLQNALLPPQNSVFNKLAVSEAPKTIVRSTLEPTTIRELPINNNLIRILAPTRAVLTEVAPLLPLFTTQETLMSRFSDIISQNADRKIPIVYDIEEAPQLISKPTKLNMTILGHVLHEMPFSRFQRNIIDSKASSNKTSKTRKKKTSAKHKQIEKQTNLTTAWLSHILTTTENMLYSEIKVQSQLESNKPKSKKINLLFKSKAKPNRTSVTGKPASKPNGRMAQNLTSADSKERKKKYITERATSVTETVPHH